MPFVQLSSGKKVKVYFAYSLDKKKRRCTTARIVDEVAKVLAEDVAVCSKLDKFEKASGRRAALELSLRMDSPDNYRPFDRADRRLIWQWYWANHKA